MRDFIVLLALKLQGVPYIYGGNSPHTGFDCSGFVIWVLQVFKVLPAGDWTAEGLRKKFPKLPYAMSSLQKGDLIFYGTAACATHVMMYCGQQMCVGAHGGGKTCISENIALLLGAKVGMKAVFYRADCIGFASIGVQ